MSKPKDIYNEVIGILNSDETLSGYVDKIYERNRDNLDASKQVLIMVEPSDILEEKTYFPLEATFVIIITGYTFEPDLDKAINDGDNKKIMDLEQDIKNALRPYYDLNGLCKSFSFTSSKFDIKKHSWGQKEKLRQPPLYGVEFYMNILYKPTFNTPGYGAFKYGYYPYGF